MLKRFDIYNEWLLDVKGVGTISAAHIIGEIDIYKAKTVSKIWQYCGLNPSKIRGKKRIQTKKPKTYAPSDSEDWPPDCPISKLIQLELLDTPYECEKCGALIVESK